MNWTVSNIFDYRNCNLTTKGGGTYTLRLREDGWAVVGEIGEVICGLDIWSALRWLNDRQAQPIEEA